MSSLMGKAMTDVELIWVIPKVKDLEYPPGDPAEPIEVIIFGQPYLIEVETHVLDNITYVILDSPVFRAQTKTDPYPPRMDDLSSAIFYSTWNQAIAATVKRFPLIDIYHINGLSLFASDGNDRFIYMNFRLSRFSRPSILIAESPARLSLIT
jgi:alpha-1,3-glucan synthase